MDDKEILEALKFFAQGQPEAQTAPPAEAGEPARPEAAAPEGVGGAAGGGDAESASAAGPRAEDLRRLQSVYDRREAALQRELAEANRKIQALEDKLLEAQLKGLPEEQKRIARLIQEQARDKERLQRELEAHRAMLRQYYEAANEVARPIVIGQLAKKHGIEDPDVVARLVDVSRQLGINTVDAAERLIEGYVQLARKSELAQRAQAGTDRMGQVQGPSQPVLPKKPTSLDEAVEMFLEAF